MDHFLAEMSNVPVLSVQLNQGKRNSEQLHGNIGQLSFEGTILLFSRYLYIDNDNAEISYYVDM